MNAAPQQRRHIVWATLIWIVASGAGLVACYFGLPALANAGMLPPVASDRASEVNQVLFLFTLLSVPVFMMVVVYMLYSVFAFRTTPNGTAIPRASGPAMRGNMPLQISWVVISVALVAFLYSYGLTFYNKISAPALSNVLQVKVTGEQWLWNYSYPQYNNASTTTLELPVGRPVEFTITSMDVQHSFWVPAMGIKEDAVPGEFTHITNVTPTQLGDYEVRCAELCGLYHAYMNSPIKVVDSDSFTNWVLQLPPAPAGADLPQAAPDMALTGVLGESSLATKGGSL